MKWRKGSTSCGVSPELPKLDKEKNSKPVSIQSFRQLFRNGKIPEKNEYTTLNNEDSTKHVLMFSTDVGRKYGGKMATSMNR